MNAPTRDLKAKVWARANLEWYVEEPRASDALFAVERFVGHIWDPACGQGNVLEAAIRVGYSVVGTDLKKRRDRFWFLCEANFLDWAEQPLGQNIVVNPPFYRGKGTEAFIRKALTVAIGKVAVFADINFLASAGRANGLYAEHPPHRVWVVTPRVSCPPGEYLAAGNKPGGGTADWCWMVWDMTAPPATFSEVRWLKGGGK
jgi:hypothetical protein